MSVYSKPYTEREGSEFQDYPERGFSIEYRDASHRYFGHIGDERQSWISVTSVLGVLDKPALRRWQGNLDAEAVLEQERAGELIGIPTERAIHVVRQRGFGAEAKRDTGADRGKAVHGALRAYCAEGWVPVLGDFDKAVRGYVQGVCGFLAEHKPEPILVEQIVGSPLHKFAGRFDLLADIDGQRTLLDLKTSGKVWPEMHAQLAGYLIAMEECGIEPPQKAMILAASEQGTFTTAECRADPQDFLAILAAHRSVSRMKAAVKA